MNKGKIINDPVYGFISFPEPELMQIIEHPWFQRLRNIRQMGMANLVYPGAVHTRFHHSMGACHLMGIALEKLKLKGVEFTETECVAARIAILLHDVGHGPFSHALEHSLVEGVPHETISRFIMKSMEKEFGGPLDIAQQIFSHAYPKDYLHQLVSSQLDMDRMDYLNRDSFYSGVSEGVIGYDRILQMLTVRNGELMVEEKAVHSVEKFIIARRLMYWQVYLHKTVLGAEHLIINILTRAKELARSGADLFATPALRFFLYHPISAIDFQDGDLLRVFCELDDTDVLASIKVWQSHKDPTLSKLCKMLINRNLYKVTLSSSTIDELLEEKQKLALTKEGITPENLHYFVNSGSTTNNTYNIDDERIYIAMKDGSVRDISEMDDPLVNQTSAKPVLKNYIYYIR
ncbi:MAG: HD domain-containing protein [Flavipsychrobacter sp.]|nr:HD domain-containing protein [Flavipsychrobacter sp.]